MFILVGVDLEQFVADVAPQFADFDNTGATVRNLSQFLDWALNCDWCGQLSPALSEGGTAKGPSSSSGASVASSAGGLARIVEDNDALRPGMGELEREKRSINEANVLASAPLPPSLLSVFVAPSPSRTSLPAQALPPPPSVFSHTQDTHNWTGEGGDRDGVDSSAPNPTSSYTVDKTTPLQVAVDPPCHDEGLLPATSSSLDEWDQVILDDRRTQINLRTSLDGEFRALQMRSIGALSGFSHSQEGCSPLVDVVERPGRPSQALAGMALEMGQLSWMPWIREVKSTLFHTSALLKATLGVTAAFVSYRVDTCGPAPRTIMFCARNVSEIEWEQIKARPTPFPCSYDTADDLLFTALLEGVSDNFSKHPPLISLCRAVSETPPARRNEVWTFFTHKGLKIVKIEKRLR